MRPISPDGRSQRLFISCVSADHQADREPLLKALTDQQIEVKIQEHFSLNGHPTLEGLHDYVRSCSHVVHIVGPTPGGIPVASSVEQLLAAKPQVATTLARHGVPAAGLTYTQWEAWFAIAYDRPLLLYSPKAFLDATMALSATPLEDLPSQQAHLRRLTTQDRWPYGFETTDKLTIEVLRKLVPEGAGDSGPDVDLGRLPETFARRLFGRDAEMKQLLEAWDSGATRIVALDAMGGAGKTALAWHFKELLKRTGWRGVRRAFAWSFYSQGSNEDRQTSADEFFTEALKFFGHDGSAFNSEHDKGAHLARLVAADRNLLILDGLEPLQYYAGSTGGADARKDGARPRREGGLKDQAMAALVRGLADAAHGLTLITTRLMVSELAQHAAPNVIHLEVRQLPLPAAVALLRSRGVCPEFPPNKYAAPEAVCEPEDGLPDGAPELPAVEAADLADLARSLRSHALAVNLAASWLVTHHGGDVRPWRHELPELPELADENERDPYRVMRAIEIALHRDAKEGSEAATLQLAILFCLGLFDRPMEPEPFKALRDKPALPGPMTPLSDASQNQFDKAVESLARKGLVDKDAGAARNQDIDCHPLVREYFGARLAQLNPETFRSAHGRLYDHYRYNAKGPKGEVLPERFRDPFAYGVLAVWSSMKNNAERLRKNPAIALREMMDAVAQHPELRESLELPASIRTATAERLRTGATLLDGPDWMVALSAFLPVDKIGMAPLFSAIRHGCLAGRHEECFNEVYWPRVTRGNADFASRKLGLYGEELAAIASFFDEPYARPNESLPMERRNLVSNIAGFQLCALGRFEDAVAPTRRAADVDDPVRATSGYATLAQLLLALGRISGSDGAVAASRLSLEAGERSEQVRSRATGRFVASEVELAAGRLNAAWALLNEAEQLWKTHQAAFPRLYSFQGYIAADMLIACGRAGEAMSRYRWHFSVRQEGDGLLTTGLEELAFARVSGTIAAHRVAVAALREANTQDQVPHGLVALAEAAFLHDDAGLFSSTMAELESMARRGPMPLFHVDATLLRARFALANGDRHAAQSKHDEAVALIARYSYGRRRPDVAVLAAEIDVANVPQAIEVLAEGWWGLIPRLEAIGADCSALRTAEAAWNKARDTYLRSTLERDVEGYSPLRDPVTAYLGVDPSTIAGEEKAAAGEEIDPATIPDSLIEGVLADPQQLAAHNELLAASGFPQRFENMGRDEQKGVVAAVMTLQRREGMQSERESGGAGSVGGREGGGSSGQVDPATISDAMVDGILGDPEQIERTNAILSASGVSKRFEGMSRAEQKSVIAAIIGAARARQAVELSSSGAERGAAETSNDIDPTSVPDDLIEAILANPQQLQAHNDLLAENNISQRFESMTREEQKALVAMIMTAQRDARARREATQTELAHANTAPSLKALPHAPKKKGWFSWLSRRR
jgi:tetratricopeptide (TPR) repeat protein